MRAVRSRLRLAPWSLFAAACAFVPAGAANAQPVGASGCWQVAMQFGTFGQVPALVSLETRAGVLIGMFRGPGGRAQPIDRGAQRGADVTFEVAAAHGRMRFDARIDGDSMSGWIHVERQGRMPFRATRAPGDVCVRGHP